MGNLHYPKTIFICSGYLPSQWLVTTSDSRWRQTALTEWQMEAKRLRIDKSVQTKLTA